MKDIFSKQSKLYAQYRPTYPKELFDFLLSLVPERAAALDCGTGSGQVASELAKYFTNVYAIDISENQIKNAVARANIVYSVQQAERTSFPDNAFDLITVAQAIHWFDFSKFYLEVDRTLKPGGILAVIGYSLCRVDPEVDEILGDFDNSIIGPYWHEERKYVDQRYQTIPFPFKEIKVPLFHASCDWTLEQMIGFISSWSAVQHYIDRNGKSPIEIIISDLRKHWGKDETKTVTFPLLLRVGVKESSKQEGVGRKQTADSSKQISEAQRTQD